MTLGLGGPRITVLAELAIVLTSVAIAARCTSVDRSLFVRLSNVCALGALVIALATLASYANLGGFQIERFSLTYNEPENPFPGRPAPEAAAALIGLSVGCLLFYLRKSTLKGYWLDHVCVSVAAVFSIITLTSYIFGDPTMESVLSPFPATAMSFIAAAQIMLLSIAFFTRNPERGIMRLLLDESAAGYMVRRLVAAVFIVPPALGVVIALGEAAGLYGRENRAALVTLGLCAIFLVFSWSIAKRLRLVDELRMESERKFRRIADRLPDPIFSYHIQPEFRVDYISPTIENIFGIMPQDLYHDPHLLERMIFPDDLPQFQKTIRNPEKYSQPTVFRWIRPDGKLIWTESSRVPVYDEFGRIERVEGVTRDITERQELLHKLHDERAWLDSLIELAPVAIVNVNTSNTEAPQLNEKARKFFGSSLSWNGKKLSCAGTLLGPDRRELSSDDLPTAKALLGESISNAEAFVRTPDGKLVPLLVSAAPIRNEEGEIVGAMTIYEDITNLKELERLREEWASVVAHDLRQPISAIEMQSTYLLKNPDKPEVVAKLAESIQKSEKQLARMTSDLLDASRLEAHRLALDLKPVRLEALTKDFIARLGLDLRGRQIVFKSAPDLPELCLDPGRFEQVLGNLLSNALKYGYEGTSIEVEVRRTNQHVELAVTNEGKGFDAESRKALFQKFQKRAKGIGLGLYITKGLVEAHGGTIDVESVPGKKTCFCIKLPLPQKQAA